VILRYCPRVVLCLAIFTKKGYTIQPYPENRTRECRAENVVVTRIEPGGIMFSGFRLRLERRGVPGLSGPEIFDLDNERSPFTRNQLDGALQLIDKAVHQLETE
jgi:hypothetical protein